MNSYLSLIATGLLTCTSLVFGQQNPQQKAETEEKIKTIIQNPNLTAIQKKALITEAMEPEMYGDKLPGAFSYRPSAKKAPASPRPKIENPEGMMALDSIVEYNGEGTPTSKTWYRYDREGNNARIYNYDNQGNGLGLNEFHHLYFNSQGNLTIDSCWRNNENTFDLLSVNEYGYDAENNQNMYSYRSNYGEWFGYKKMDSVNIEGDKISTTNLWNQEENRWIPDYRSIYNYNYDELRFLYIQQLWDNENSNWYSVSKRISTIQPNHQLLTDSTFTQTDYNSPLTLIRYYELIKDSEGKYSVGRVHTRITPEESWQLESETQFHYDDDDQLVKDSMFYQNPVDEGWSQQINYYNQTQLQKSVRLKFYDNWGMYIYDSTITFYKENYFDTLAIVWTKVLPQDPWVMASKSRNYCDTLNGMIYKGNENFSSRTDEIYDSITGELIERDDYSIPNSVDSTFLFRVNYTYQYDSAGNQISILNQAYYSGSIIGKSMLNYTFDYEANINEYLLPSNWYYTYSSIALADTNYHWNTDTNDWEVTTHKRYFYSPFSYQALPVNKAFSAGHLTLYPNPASEAVTIEQPTEGGQIEVLSITGQVIISQPAEGRVTRLDVSNFKSGLYLVRVTNGNTIYSNRLLVR